MKRKLDKVLEDKSYLGSKTVELSFSCSKIEISAMAGKCATGSFKVFGDEHYKPEGYVYCNDLRMKLKNNTFMGLDMEIGYNYDTSGLESGSQVNGCLFIISNLGEYELPYCVTITSKYPDSSLGAIKNLFHFANLAQTDWEEACNLFYSKQFENILCGNDSKFLPVYRGLSSNIGNARNVDEFLQIVKKKKRASFNVDISDIHVNNPVKDVERRMCIVRDGWGILEISVRISGEGVEPTEFFITNEDFKGNNYEINLKIRRALLHKGKNEAQVEISDSYNTVIVPIVVNAGIIAEHEHDTRRDYRTRIMRLYMEYRLGTINKNEWLKECNSLVGRALQKDSNDVESRLYQVQLLYSEKRASDAVKILDRISGMTGEMNPDMQGYYYYLRSLNEKDKDAQKKLVNEAELLYVKNIKSWRLAYVVMHMKSDYVNNDMNRWEFIKKQYNSGSNSIALFIEALSTAIANPSVITAIDDFEKAFLTFTVRHNSLTRDIRNRFVFLAENVTSFDTEVYNLLVECYALEKKDETLTRICTLLMKGNCIGEEYFKWYARAVDKELRINKLYEYYITSIGLDYEGMLPKLVLMYFAFRSNLDYERNAFLYANILKNRSKYQDIYSDYRDAIKEFAIEQLMAGRNNYHLSYIYSEVLKEELGDTEYATAYSKIAFVSKLHTSSNNMINAIVINQRLETETVYPIYNRETDIVATGDDCVILLEDAEGNRYASDSLYTITKYDIPERLVLKVMENAEYSLYQALYLARVSNEKAVVNDVNENAFLWLAESPEVNDRYRIEIMILLIKHYFDTDDIGRLDELLAEIDSSKLKGDEFESCVHILVARGMYEKAFEWVRACGLEYVDVKILVRMCDRLLVRNDFEYDADLLKMCMWIYCDGKYDETILNYLLMYQQGASKDLKGLWRAADSFGLDVHRFLENLIVQLMYTGAKIGEEGNIYLEYIKDGSNNEIEKLFLTKLSYEYFVNDSQVNGEVFERVKYMNDMDEEISDYCYLALLKRDAEQYRRKGLDTKERAVVERYLKYVCDRKLFFPFFMEFRSIWQRLEMFEDRDFVEYRGTEGSKVVLHYVLESGNGKEEKYSKVEMEHMIGGIYIYSFILFEGEKVKYYITEEDSRKEKLTKSSIIVGTNKGGNARGRYARINDISQHMVAGEDSKAINMLSEYSKEAYLAESIFYVDVETM